MNGPARAFLPYGRQQIEDDDVAAVAAVLRSDYLTTGPTVGAFEAAFAARTGARHAAVCANGTAALHLAAMALDLGPDDAVVVPSMTFLATANAARFVGAEVVFADVDPDTGLLTAETLEDALARSRAAGRKPRAVFPVHLNGQTADMAAIATIAKREGLRIVEDACHVLGGAYLDGGVERPVGSCHYGDLTIFSFHPVKAIAMGEGGCVTSNDAALHDKVLHLRNHGIERDPSRFELNDLGFDERGAANPWHHEMPAPGYNYRASDIHCALGLSQLGKLDRFVAERARVAALYDERLAALAPALRPVARVAWCRPAWHLYAVQIDYAGLGLDRAGVMGRLRDQGIGTQVHYIPVHRQPYYQRRYGAQSLPGAEAYFRGTLSLPLFPAMTEVDVARVVAALAAICGRNAA